MMKLKVLESKIRESNQNNGSTCRVKAAEDSVVSFVVGHSGSSDSNNGDNKEGVNGEIEKRLCERPFGS